MNETLKAIFDQYEKTKEEKNKPKGGSYTPRDMNMYFSTYLPDGVDDGEKVIRVLPQLEGEDFFNTEVMVHSKKVNGEYAKLMCPKTLNKDDECPMCEGSKIGYNDGSDSGKEKGKELRAKKMHIIRLIDRDNEEQGIKWYRFWDSYKMEGVYDKIIDIMREYDIDVTDPNEGMDLKLKIKRDPNNKRVCRVTSILPQKQGTKLHEDEAKAKEWLSANQKWNEGVYSVKGYEYLRLVAVDKTPIYSKEHGKYVAKEDLDNNTNQVSNSDILSGKHQQSETTSNPQDFTSSVEAAPQVQKTETTQAPETAADNINDDDLPF